MSKFKFLALGVLLASVNSTAFAAGDLAVGVGAGWVENAYKEYKNYTYPVPVINYEGDNFWVRGLGAGYYLWNDSSDKLSVLAYYAPQFFKPGDSDNNQLRELDRRRSSVMAGLSWIHDTPYGFLRTSLAGDVLDNSNGFIGDIAWLYRYTDGPLTLVPGIGVEWSSENQNDYYYGISGKESRRSGLNRYDPNDSWNPYAELTVSYRINDSWSVYGSGRYTRLSSEIKDSPMVDKSWTGILSTGVTYRF